MATPITGKDAKVIFTAEGGTPTPLTLKNQMWTVNIEDNLVRGYNTSDGIFRAAGVPDLTGTITGPIDMDELISTQIERYAVGQLQLFADDTVVVYNIPDAIFGTPVINPNGENEIITWTVNFALHTGDYETFPGP